MRRPVLSALAVLLAGALAAGCGGGDDGGDVERVAKLTAAEFPLVQRFLNGEVTSTAAAQQLCDDLDAGPDTPVVGTAQEACEEGLPVAQQTQAVGTRMTSACQGPPTDRCITALRDFRNQAEAQGEVLGSFNDGIDEAISEGPCRAALRNSDVEQYDAYLKAYDAALKTLEDGGSPKSGLGPPPVKDTGDISACKP